ncbi:hypothetical protein GCM10011487_19260 [Steroidobacter agaridevorans]|uniref:Uncharacterized protein n=1 Tax=Steroidobacter agaridevorans TaxID=2695856 RepID=A0A829YB60_9GAMM|nr:DUF5695 domain-containing protein [Steroidobacter agaridevorans]GFE79926.1 hypothetical protein GCM10011487_19260 [Steroidobacter agaridevorans]
MRNVVSAALRVGAVWLFVHPLAMASTALTVQSRDFDVVLDGPSQTLVSLKPKQGAGFDFAPSKLQSTRSGDGYYQLGDIDLRLRTAGESQWQDYSTAFRREPARELPRDAKTLAAGEVSMGLPSELGLRVVRRWQIGDNGNLSLRFELTNAGQRDIELGGVGLAMVFDNVLSKRSLAEAHTEASFADPYIGLDAGYLQVTRLNGQGPALIVAGENGTPFEAYRPIADKKDESGKALLLNDATQRGQTFEGFYTWMAASRGFAEREWKGAEQWNEPTTVTLRRGETRRFGVQFLVSKSIREIENTLAANARPVAVGIPGYVLPTDLTGDLWLSSRQAIRSVVAQPAGALVIAAADGVQGWSRYRVTGKQWGRSRLTITYADGTRQAVHYFVTKPSATVLDDLGRFIATKHWYDDPSDPFKRGPSFMTYDRERNAVVLQDQRVWMAGLSDEGGAGAWLALVMKQLGAPNASEIERFERFVTQTLDGRLQVNEGPEKFGVRKSLFYYEPQAPQGVRYDPAIDWTKWSAWRKSQADSVVRSFNYVHVAAAHWVLYRLARYHEGLVKAHDWRWYLDRAYQTALAMPKLAPEYAKFGQMEGEVFIEILRDLQDEGMKAEASQLEQAMRERADHWAAEEYPFGSEMPWDSTGQPEVYAWMRYFGNTAKADLTREVILGYDPTLPSWGYNGNARRYWDFMYAGKTAQLERQLHHYGSANNALPLLDSFRRDPRDIHLLRVAYGGLMGTLTNIDQDGFGSAAFHSNPDLLRFDGYNGDYGSAFYGYAYGIGSYLARHPVFGNVGFGGSTQEQGSIVSFVPRDGFRTRVFLAEAGLWLTLDAGKFARLDYDRNSGNVSVYLDRADKFTPKAQLRLESTRSGAGYRPSTTLNKQRGRYVISLGKSETSVQLTPAR